MKKWDYCKQYKQQCVNCPRTNIVQGDKYDSYMICDFHLRAVRDGIDKILQEREGRLNVHS